MRATRKFLAPETPIACHDNPGHMHADVALDFVPKATRAIVYIVYEGEVDVTGFG